jgi:hypothetical protein
MSGRAQDVRKFLRAAELRLKAAEFLFEHGFHLDSMYLGGYAVECGLKALILRRTPLGMYDATYAAITTGRVAHNFGFLRARLQRSPVNCSVPDAIGRSFRSVSSWSSDLRYETAALDAEEAREFLDATRGILSWSMRS